MEFIQEWRSNVDESPKCVFYKEIKHDFILEPFIYRLPIYLALYLIKFRTCNHKLEIEVGRYVNTERSERKCKMCNINSIGDEYHLIFECSNEKIVKLRKKYIPSKLLKNANMSRFVNLFSLFNKNVYIRLCKFLKFTDVF